MPFIPLHNISPGAWICWTRNSKSWGDTSPQLWRLYNHYWLTVTLEFEDGWRKTITVDNWLVLCKKNVKKNVQGIFSGKNAMASVWCWVVHALRKTKVKSNSSYSVVFSTRGFGRKLKQLIFKGNKIPLFFEAVHIYICSFCIYDQECRRVKVDICLRQYLWIRGDFAAFASCHCEPPTPLSPLLPTKIIIITTAW